jgi:alanine-glyoxylate transaminase/serine-glyoxylate transaminase/serine-pyruvate transaminase
MNINSFNPNPVLLMGAAPAGVDERVLNALSKPIVSHLDKSFIKLMNEICYLIRYIFQTSNTFTFPIQGPASAAMEAAFLNLIEPEDTVIVCENGLYGERMSEILRLYDANVIPIHHEWGEAIDINRVSETLKKYPNTKLVCAVHGESSTGVISNIQGIGEICKDHEALFLVDVACTIINENVKMDEWGIDTIYCNSQKSIASSPGLAPFSLSEKAINCIKKRKTPVKSYFLDFDRIMENWHMQEEALRTYHHTAAVNNFYALHEALSIIHNNGLDVVQNQYKQNAMILKNGLKELGVEFFTPESLHVPIVNVINIESEQMQRKIIDSLYFDHNIQISGGLGKLLNKVIRISALGTSNNIDDINRTLDATKKVLHNWKKSV